MAYGETWGIRKLIAGWWLKFGPIAAMWYLERDGRLRMKVTAWSASFEHNWR